MYIILNNQKTAVWHRDPIWKIPKPQPKNQEVADRINDLNELRQSKILQKFEEKKIDVKGDVLRSYEKMDHWKRILISYNNVYIK